jgi:hypothetical protein
MKNDLPYFSHYSTTHDMPKIQALMTEFGMVGYGRYWVLCEKVAASPNAALDISNRAVKLAVAKALELRADEFDNFINFLSDPEIGLVKFDLGKITVDQLAENYNRVSKKRQHDRDTYYSENFPRSDLQVSLSETSFPNSENIQSKVNKSKINKSSSSSTTVGGEPTTTDLFINSCNEAGFFLDKKKADIILNTGIDLSWLYGAFTFPGYVADKIQEAYSEKPESERKRLFISALTWEDCKAEFPKWREKKIAEAVTLEEHRKQEAAADAERKRVEQARADKPEVCAHCGASLAVDGERGTCEACGWGFSFNEESGQWVFQEPFSLKDGLESIVRRGTGSEKISSPRYEQKRSFIFFRLKKEGLSDEEANQKAIEEADRYFEIMGA